MTEVEAPDLAAVIQRGFPFDESVVEMVRSYCEPLKRAEVDTVILGCTHYPLVAPMLQRTLGRDVRLVTAGHAIAATAQRVLEESGLTKTGNEEGDLPLPLHRGPRVLPRAGHALPADAAGRGRAAWSCPDGRFGVIDAATVHSWVMVAITPEKVPFFPWGLLLIALGFYVVAVAALIAAGRREDARALAGFIPDCLVLVSRLARDRRISRPRRALLFARPRLPRACRST